MTKDNLVVLIVSDDIIMTASYGVGARKAGFERVSSNSKNPAYCLNYTQDFSLDGNTNLDVRLVILEESYSKTGKSYLQVLEELQSAGYRGSVLVQTNMPAAAPENFPPDAMYVHELFENPDINQDYMNKLREMIKFTISDQ